MSNPTATFTPLGYPAGQAYNGNNSGGMDQTYNHVRLMGTVAIAPGTSGAYPASGVPISFTSAMAGYNPSPFIGWMKSNNQGWSYSFDPVNQSVRIIEQSQFTAGYGPGVVAGDFAASANWGTSPTLSPSATSTQLAFALTITAQNTTGANPTITLTFPTRFQQAPVFVCNRGDSLSDTGYFVFTSSTESTVVFTFVGTPTATHVYVLEAYGKASDLAVAAVASTSFAASSGWGTSPTLAINGTSTQEAFQFQITCQATTAANPTITFTYPSAYASAPQWVIARADTLSDAGYWVVTSSSATAAVFTFIGTPTATHVYKFVALLSRPLATAVTASAFAASSGWGTGATIAVSGNQSSFTLSVTTPASGQGANPTIILTFPSAFAQVPQFVCSRGDSLSTAGYWVVTYPSSATTTAQATFTFIGTPGASSTYTLDAIAKEYSPGSSEFPVGGTIPLSVINDTIYIEVLTTRT